MILKFVNNPYSGAHTRARPPVACRLAHTIVGLHGEIDIATSPALRMRLRDALQRSEDVLILDLSHVSFCDASGLRVLVGIQRRTRQRGITLRLAGPSPLMTRLLQITGLDQSFTIHPTLSSAIASTHRDPVD
ncbi:anti-sigma factor antagonist [Planotetraspora thailandica]|uniref:Anti-sigma factor antagonist n=1 Tax=Planotetraspora thailandica TaxID=487172 RepID=A0A8J3XXU9_9ACTN|nr:STAS domain-containing protein [Planotetraspora thailandica]GII53493.1 anti-sigma factor antagonist [Planotetraspora thailandica]